MKFKCAHCVAFHLTQLKQYVQLVRCFYHQDLIGSRRIPKASCEDCGRIDPSRRCGMISFRSPPWNIDATWQLIEKRMLCVEYDETSQAWRCFLGASRLLGALDTCRVRHCPRGLRMCHISECHIKRYHINHIESVPIFRFYVSLASSLSH